MLRGGSLDAIGEQKQPRIVGCTFGKVGDVEVEPAQRFVFELHMFDGHERR